MTAHAQPAPGTNPSMPTPAAPTAEPTPAVEATPQAQEPVPAGGPTDSPVNAAAAASAQNQAAQAAAAAEPAPAPVAEPAPAPIIETGNTAFDQVGALLNGKGLDGVTGILEEAAKGEISLASKAKVIEALGADVANLALGQLEGEVTRQREAGQANANAMKTKLAEQLGAQPEQAEQVWDTLNDFARSAESGFTADDRTALNKLLASGGLAADMAMNELANRYRKSQGFSQEPNLVQGQGGLQSNFEPLSKAEYVDQMGDAQRKFGEGSREVEALRNRRMLSLQRGY